jgi:hypothetical protein
MALGIRAVLGEEGKERAMGLVPKKRGDVIDGLNSFWTWARSRGRA